MFDFEAAANDPSFGDLRGTAEPSPNCGRRSRRGKHLPVKPGRPPPVLGEEGRPYSSTLGRLQLACASLAPPFPWTLPTRPQHIPGDQLGQLANVCRRNVKLSRCIP